MFPAPPTQSGGLAPEPVSGDSLTQYIRALANYLQSQGQSTFNSGQQVVGQGTDQVAAAPNTLQPSIDYWTSILSGDPTKMTQAVAPTATAIGNQFDAAKRGVETGSPRGGFSSGIATNLPFQKAGQIGNLFSGLQPQAAQALPAIAQTQAGIGTQLGQLGLGESGLGFNMFNLAQNGQLARRGQNVNADATSNPFTALMGQGIGLLGGVGGKLAGKALGLG